MPTVRLDPLDYAAAADNFRAITDSALTHFANAASELRRYGAMAGDDNGGQDFADAYDGSAQIMLQSLHDIAVTCSAFDRGLTATGRLHHQAEQFSAGLPADDGAFVLRPLVAPTCVAGPPSAYGGPAEPGIIDVVRDIFALIWPNADTALMKQAATTWTGISDDFSALARAVRQSTSPLGSAVSGEVSSIQSKVDDLADGIDELATNAGDIADVCRGYADDVDDAHNEILPMIAQLVAEIAIGAGLSVALSFVTFGGAAAVGAAAIAIRAAAVAARVGSILFRVLSTAGRVAMRLRQIAIALRNVSVRFERLSEVGREIVASTGSALLMETQNENPNYAAAAVGGFLGGGIGGGITAALASRTASLAARIGAGTLAGTASGAGGVVADNLVRYGRVDARELLVGTIAGGALGGPASVIPKPGGGSPGGGTPDGGAPPKVDSPNLPRGDEFDGDLPGLDAPEGPDSTPGGGGSPLSPGTSTVISTPDLTPGELGGSGHPGGDTPSTSRGDTPTTTPDGDIPTAPDGTPHPAPDGDATAPDTTTTPDTTTAPDTTTVPDTTAAPDTTTAPDGETTPSDPTTAPDADPTTAPDTTITASPADALHMTGGPDARIDVDAQGGQRLLDEPQTFGDPSPRPDPDPTPADVLARDDVQQLLTGPPPRLVLEDGVLRLAHTQEVTFAASNPSHPLPEFLRQGALQEGAANRLTVDQIVANQANYDLNGRTGASEQAAYRRDVDMSDSPYDANDVLHSLDQNAGGDPLSFDGVGHSGVNRSLGSQWRTRAPELAAELRRLTDGIPVDVRRWIHPNVEIRIVDVLASGRIQG